MILVDVNLLLYGSRRCFAGYAEEVSAGIFIRFQMRIVRQRKIVR